MNRKNLRIERERHRQEENRIFILQAAEKVFVQKGYRVATVDDIAAEAQFSKATLYRYFKSKSEIFFEIILSTLEESHSGIKKIQLGAKSSEKKLRELIEFIVTTYHKKKNLSRILFMERAAMKNVVKKNSGFQVSHPDVHPKISPRLISKMRQISDIVNEIIREGVETGEFREMDARDASVVLEALLRGFYFHGPIPQRHYSIHETTDLLFSFFLHGIKKQKKAKNGD
jgi:AcrR family transcriptional regulator